MISKKAVQHGLERENTGKLQTLWVEVPGRCNLACSYCYACGGEKLDTEKLMRWREYESILMQAAHMGVDSLGIPGAGEPLLGSNLMLTEDLIVFAAKYNMFTTLFTTGEFITSNLLEGYIWWRPVEIMIKCNTLDPNMQDKFVSDPARGIIKQGYGKKRNEAIELLINHGFNDEQYSMRKYGRKSRMALVTSIMTSEDGSVTNLKELADILRFCRRHNIIFDCDSVLKRGRGATCGLCAGDEELRQILLELQRIDREEFGNVWEISQSYVGTVCDRYMHHLYINQYGDIRPCIGAMDVNLGNIRNVLLEEAWNSKEMRIIRKRCYHGKCGDECANFAEGKCNSCLGRRTRNLTNEHLLSMGYVETIGCWNFR